MPNSYKWKTAGIIKETNDALTIVFDTGNTVFNFTAGQFVNLTFVLDNTPIIRSYSLSNAPDEDEKPAITVKRVAGGLISNYIFDNATQINYWEVNGPYGSFYVSPELQNKKNIVLIGGGSGMSPLNSILKYYLKHTNASITLINCNRTWEDVIFKYALNFLERTFSDRLFVWHVLSRASRNELYSCKNFSAGKLNKLILKKWLKKELGVHLNEADYFVCGPKGLLQLAMDSLASLNVNASQIHFEYFITPQNDSPISLPDTPKEVLFHYYEQSNLLEVKPGTTILAAALEEKMPINYSCKNGTCGLCIGKQTTGKIHMRKNLALTEEQVNEGYVLLCQSHPIDDYVTVTVE